MSNTDKELDVFIWPDIFRPIGPSDDLVVSSEKLRAYIAKSQNQLIDKLLKEVIGEDEERKARYSQEHNDVIYYRNRLRATQREAINKLRSSNETN